MQITISEYPFSNYFDVSSGELLAVIFIFFGLLILLGLTSIYFMNECYKSRKLIRENRLNKEISIYFRNECYKLRKLIRENKYNKKINIIKKEIYKK